MCARNNNRPAEFRAPVKRVGAPVILNIHWFVIIVCASKWCACNFCFAGKGDSKY